MKFSREHWLILVSLLMILPVGLFAWRVAKMSDEPLLLDSDPMIVRNRSQKVGGVSRPLSDIGAPALRSVSSRIDPKLDQVKPYNTIFGLADCPKIPKLVKGTDSQVDSIIEAITTKSHYERLSPYVEPTKFDAEKWQSDSSEYLAVAEPGRVFDTAQPESGAPALKGVSSRLSKILLGESVRLVVQTTPNAPASFTIFGTGSFANGTGAITVAADDAGLATAVFTNRSTDRSDILAGSPTSSGTIRFNVRVTEAK